MNFEGLEHVSKRATSPWAERAWCSECGSGLWYRITKSGRFSGSYELPIGLLDDLVGLSFTRELFIDKKPDAFSFAGEASHKLMTEERLERLFRRYKA